MNKFLLKFIRVFGSGQITKQDLAFVTTFLLGFAVVQKGEGYKYSKVYQQICCVLFSFDSIVILNIFVWKCTELMCMNEG